MKYKTAPDSVLSRVSLQYIEEENRKKGSTNVQTENFRFRDEDDYKYEIFSILSIAHAWICVILAGKRDIRRHSAKSFSDNVVMTGTSYQM